MAIIASDLLVRSAIEAAIYHLRQNTWLLPDVWGGLANDSILKSESGYKEVDAAIKWFLSNNINVFAPFRIDLPTFPCITVVNTSTSEDLSKTMLGDYGSEETDFDPRGAALLPQKVYGSFTPKAYDPSKGKVTFPDTLTTDILVPGQFLVTKKGKAYQVLKVFDQSSFEIKEGVKDDFLDAYIVPPTTLWNLKREMTYLQESFAIGCHAQSDPVQAIWLRQLVMYILFRYKEAYLEARGLQLSTIQAGGVDLNNQFEKEKVFTSIINMEGTMEANWIKYTAPKLQSVTAKIIITDGSKTPPSEIIANPSMVMQDDELP